MTDTTTDILNPPTVTVTVGGKTLTITPLRARMLSKAAGLARVIIDAVTHKKGEGELDLALALADHSAEIVILCALLTDQDALWVGDLYPDELIKLAEAVVVVNLDFFTQRMAPTLSGVMAGLAPPATGLQTPSNA